MRLAHRGPELALKATVELAKLAVAVTLQMDLPVLLPQKVKRHPHSLQLLMDPSGVRCGPLPPRLQGREQPCLQGGVVHLRRQRPAEARSLGPAHVLRHCPDAHPAGPGDGPMPKALFVLKPQDFPYPSHR